MMSEADRKIKTDMDKQMEKLIIQACERISKKKAKEASEFSCILRFDYSGVNFDKREASDGEIDTSELQNESEFSIDFEGDAEEDEILDLAKNKQKQTKPSTPTQNSNSDSDVQTPENFNILEGLEEKCVAPRKSKKYSIFTTEEKSHILNYINIHGKQYTTRRFHFNRKFVYYLTKKGYAERKEGSGRHPKSLEMEQRLLNWIREKVENLQEFPSMIEQREMAKLLSSDPTFKASKGWRERFYERNKVEFKRLKRLYYASKLKTISEENSIGSEEEDEVLAQKEITKATPSFDIETLAEQSIEPDFESQLLKIRRRINMLKQENPLPDSSNC